MIKFLSESDVFAFLQLYRIETKFSVLNLLLPRSKVKCSKTHQMIINLILFFSDAINDSGTHPLCSCTMSSQIQN